MEINESISKKFEEALRLIEKNLDELNRKDDSLNNLILENNKNILHVNHIYDTISEVCGNIKKTESELMDKIELRLLNKLLTTIEERIDKESNIEKIKCLLEVYSELSENDIETTKKILNITDIKND